MAEAAEVMTKKHREILRRHRLELVENLQPLKLLSHLTSVLSQEDEEEIRAERTTTEQARCLLDLLPRRGDKAFEAFVRALEKTQRFLAIPIAEEGEIELLKTKHGYNEHAMQPEHKEILRSSKEVLKQINLKKVLRLMTFVFDKEDKEAIDSNTTGDAKLDEFVTILGKKEDKAFDHFIEILNITDPSIAKFLVKEKTSSNTSNEKELTNPTQILNPEDDTEIRKVKDKLASFCQKTNENEGWKSLAQHFQVPPDKVDSSFNPTNAVLNLLPTRKVGELKSALTHLGMTANIECLMNDLGRQPDTTDSPGSTNPVNNLVENTKNLSIDKSKTPKESKTLKPVETFGDLSDENQERLLAEIEAEELELKYSFEIPPHDQWQKYKIRELTKLLRKNKMKKTIEWMKDNLPKGVTGPYFDENTNVRDLPYSARSKLTVQLCAHNENWKILASHLGLSNTEIQYFDSHRFRNPADEVLRQWETKRNTSVGELYDILVFLNMPVIADSVL
ncbi:uncharacterized protein LOC116298219 isoform X2 [Actinia tenebrosa]|uniref:Uncharacterized protein LOC116298219 isoform X2 n=1 Tax=Actinia tenebrosa TaxID=6105 RepID=A0A6P8I3N2_ACTTE|nr:uncharacterized protein LOC116298219 isoform X2 [Actinia tenebrosa]